MSSKFPITGYPFGPGGSESRPLADIRVPILKVKYIAHDAQTRPSTCMSIKSVAVMAKDNEKKNVPWFSSFFICDPMCVLISQGLVTDWPAGMRRQIHAVSMGLATEEHLHSEDAASHMHS